MPFRNRTAAYLFFLCFFFTASLWTAGTQSQANAASDSTEQFLTLVPPRPQTEIQRDIELTDQVRSAAVEAERAAREQRTLAATRLEEKKKAISSNKDKLKIARRENKESEVLVLTTEGKALERDKELLEQREALRDAEINLAIRRNELATLTKRALDLELQLAEKRAQQPEASVSTPESARAARILVDMERAVLEAQKRAAQKQDEVADGAQKVIDRQLKTLQAQIDIYGGK